MQKKIVTAMAVGTLGLSALALSAPALAAATAPTTTSSEAAQSPVDRITSALSGLVTDKTLTQAQADKVATTLGAADLGRGGRGGPGGGVDLATAATTLGISEADLRTALESGKTLAQVATDKKVSVDTLIAALVTQQQTRIAQDVKDGRLTQAQADERLADLKTRVTDRVNSTRPSGARDGSRDGGPGKDGGPKSGTTTPQATTPAPTTTS